MKQRLAGAAADDMQQREEMAVPAQAPAPVNAFQKFGFIFLLAYLFILYSRVFDIKLYQLHIPAISTTFTLLFTIVSGGAIVALGSKPGRLLAAFTLWMCLCIPFSAWPRLSFFFWTQSWPRTMIVFLALAGLVYTFAEFRHTVFALAAGISALALLTLKFGDMVDGRLFLPAGKFSNPNDLAQVLLMGLPFLLYVLMTSNMVLRVAAGLCMLPIFYCLIRTGSRGGLLGFSVIAVFIFLRAPATGKALVMAASIGVLMAAAILLPQNLKQRYVTLFSTVKPSVSLGMDAEDLADEGHLQDMAAASANSRQQLLKDSLRLTFQHPLFGIGPALFPTVEEQEQLKKGIHVPSLGTHNSYTQISCETGIPGFLLYFAVFWYAVRRTNAISRFAAARAHPKWKDISRMAFCLKISLLSYAVTSFFSHVAYDTFLPTLVGLVVAMERSVQPEFQAWRARRGRPAIPAPATVYAPSLPAHEPAPLSPRRVAVR